ncbi:MAG: GNAT family N-acetyltransferase [Methylocella sp.]
MSVKTSMDGDHVEVLRDVSDIERLRGFWLACNPSRDADPDLFRFLIETRPRGDTPCILILRAGGELKALLVGRLIRARLPIKIAYFRIPSPELRMLVISSGGWLGEIDETRAALFVASLRHLLANGEADAAVLHYSELTSPLARQALAQPAFACRDHLIIRERYRVLDLPVGDKSFLASLSKKKRYSQRERDRKLANDFAKVRIDAFSSPEDINRLMHYAETIAQKSWQRGIGGAFAASNDKRARYEFLARMGWLRSFVLCLDDRPSAFWIGTLRHGVFISDYMAFDPVFGEYWPGMYLILRVIEILAKDGTGPARQIVFGLGDEAYKQRLTKQAVEVALVYIFAPNFRGLTANLLRSSLGRVNYTLKTLLGGTVWLAIAKRKWRVLPSILTGRLSLSTIARWMRTASIVRRFSSDSTTSKTNRKR